MIPFDILSAARSIAAERSAAGEAEARRRWNYRSTTRAQAPSEHKPQVSLLAAAFNRLPRGRVSV
jgi:hypothetical protein